MNQSAIDFVVTWVDSSDPDWIQDYKYYSNEPIYRDVSDFSPERFRDWDNLKYWFRGIDEFAPWVRKIHFVTRGHLPSWLNVKHEKLHIVKHKDYIDEKYLPTFNSRVIELSLVNLPELSEHFVLFNDDFFVNNELEAVDFFSKDGQPNDFFVYNAESGGGLAPIIMNNLSVINDNFDKKEFMNKNFFKVFNFKYGKNIFRNIFLLSWPRYTGFYESHLPQPYRKSYCQLAYSMFEKEILSTLSSRFRLKSDINHYLYRYYQLCSGEFNPVSPENLGKYFSATESSLEKITYQLKYSDSKVVAINDNNEINDFIFVKNYISKAMESKFPNKSSFEL